ncbi:MAG TPA: hypothetical protein VK835_03420 [Bacteroidia bacterium]|jgi:hypothetical protein|nr:hypothetical protein [Bacteroidia bacterium]
METQTFSKKSISTLLILALFFSRNMLAQQNKTIEEDVAPTHSIIFILSVLFFILGFAVFIVLKLRDDAKEKKDAQSISHHTKHRHLHRNHYGHRHQYNH